MSICDNTSRLMYQYADSPNFVALVRTLYAENCNISADGDALMTRLDIDLSEGIQLDRIGEIIGQVRPLNIQIDENDAFAFRGSPSGVEPDPGTGKGWSGQTRPDIGGRFVGINGLIIGKMIDADYRTLLRARIFSNVATGTVDDIGQFLQFTLGAGTYLVHNYVGYVDVEIDRALSSTEEDIITILIPLAAGVRLNDIIQP